MYTVTVTGTNADKESKEFGRQVINRCDTGIIPRRQLEARHGRADIQGNFVDMKYGNESRVMSTTKRDPRMQCSPPKPPLRSGWGYGIWTRAPLRRAPRCPVTPFQYDPGYANVNPGFGKALLLRVQTRAASARNPVAKVRRPEGPRSRTSTRWSVVNKGDTLYASIDGIKMFDVRATKDRDEELRLRREFRRAGRHRRWLGSAPGTPPPRSSSRTPPSADHFPDPARPRSSPQPAEVAPEVLRRAGSHMQNGQPSTPMLRRRPQVLPTQSRGKTQPVGLADRPDPALMAVGVRGAADRERGAWDVRRAHRSPSPWAARRTTVACSPSARPD